MLGSWDEILLKAHSLLIGWLKGLGLRFGGG